MSWTCPHCEAELDDEKINRRGVILGMKEIENFVYYDAKCSTCSKPIRVQYISHTVYKPCAVDKRAQLTLVTTNQET